MAARSCCCDAIQTGCTRNRPVGLVLLAPQPATQPPAAPPQWRVSLDQLWVANAAGAVSYVHYTGRLLEPGPGVLPPAVDGAWQPACVLQHRKPRHLWTFEERAAYDAASPGERAGAWPRAPYFLAPEAGVVVHPEHCRIAGVSLADYTLLTAQLKAAKLEHFVAIWAAGGALCEVEEVQAPGRLWAFLHSASCGGLEPA
ncbi:hypothetical protein CHLRE_16g669549v5 [Chlamydomonas reinhardtii]|uniref:Uncharacterized protein n=1 Tax=Chlamydomonas reinhardtii TaxID=3055 RepID=A0A2K3CTX9_CHLRE|nr:uncharacterized protein CHLRE_16g669549v5 [Chlamydomonas reinhardtii]PNW71742.1 hypothetical protein CHLRE_16g669549v5 [Chlamydomonas reinhardtii]